MKHNIDTSISEVNRYIYLTGNRTAYIVRNMKYGERLRLARERANMTQAALADATQLRQPTISYLENPNNNCQGSEFTARFARVLDVSVDWLADEIGEMAPTYYRTSDPKIIAAIKVMEDLPEYARDEAIKSVATIEKLVHRKNGTTDKPED